MRRVIARRPQRIATWLCLALTLFTGIVPARGMVLCVEADGCVRIEIKDGNGQCGGCGEHLDEPHSAAVEQGDADEGICPCVDLDVPGAKETPRPRVLAAERLDTLFVLPSNVFLPVPAAAPSAYNRLQRERPRPPDTLRLIHSVVLLR